MQTAKRNQRALGRDEHVLASDIRAFEQRREQLERDHFNKFALFFQGEFVGVFPDFDSAGRAALSKSPKGPYLIQQIGSPVGLDADTARHLHAR
ncbi:hypothetical protein [Candidatus Binatus soli]|jgi:hypothetical protein|uniref:hypothetical protein n=1 Tax=Candidatus Binatus soli TaxID=1953413 RepID=UPI003D0CC41C